MSAPNRPGTPDSWTEDPVADARSVLGEGISGNSVTARLVRDDEVRAIEVRAAEVLSALEAEGSFWAPAGGDERTESAIVALGRALP